MILRVQTEDQPIKKDRNYGPFIILGGVCVFILCLGFIAYYA